MDKEGLRETGRKRLRDERQSTWEEETRKNQKLWNQLKRDNLGTGRNQEPAGPTVSFHKGRTPR